MLFPTYQYMNMNTKTLLQASMETPEINPAFKVVIAYETGDAGMNARDRWERLAAELRAEFDAWNTDLLVHPQLCQRAAASASEADMIIIETRERESLPVHVKDWIESWLPQKRRGPTALVALLPDEDKTLAHPPPVYEYLSQVSARGGLDFFCNAGEWRVPDFQNARETEPYGAEDELVQSLSDSVGRNWGIND
jgi:hypothetical protein